MNVYCLYCSRLIESCLVRTFDTDVDEIKGRSECLLCQNNYQQIKSSTRTLKCVVLECSTLKFGFCFSFYVPSSNDDFKLLRNLLVLTLLCREL